MIEFLSAGSYPHVIMLLVRLFILLKLFLFARLRSTDDTMLLQRRLAGAGAGGGADGGRLSGGSVW